MKPIYLLWLLFVCSCQTKNVNPGFKINVHTAREFEFANKDSYEEIRNDILSYKKEYPSKFDKEHCFRIFAQPKDSLIIMMVDTSNFGNACTKENYDFFYVDTLFISLITDFQKGMFKFKQNTLIPHFVNLGIKPVITNYQGIYDPKTWFYKYNNKNEVKRIL